MKKKKARWYNKRHRIDDHHGRCSSRNCLSVHSQNRSMRQWCLRTLPEALSLSFSPVHREAPFSHGKFSSSDALSAYQIGTAILPHSVTPLKSWRANSLVCFTEGARCRSDNNIFVKRAFAPGIKTSALSGFNLQQSQRIQLHATGKSSAVKLYPVLIPLIL